MKKLTTSEFIDRAKKIHGEKYDYSKVNYTHNHVKTKIRCHLHGDFEIVAYSHLAGHGCNNCYNERRALTRKGFIERAIRLHNNKYDYSNVVYTIGRNRISIICPIHGAFMQFASAHLEGNGCGKCYWDNHRISSEEFIRRASRLHKNFYDYSKTQYRDPKTKVQICCPNHGPFYQLPYGHLGGQGCKKCSYNISREEIKFLNRLLIKEENRQQKIEKFLVDGIDKSSNTIYEFLGDFWHGNPKLFSPKKVNRCTKTTFGNLYDFTFRYKFEKLKRCGYTIKFIWENEWKKWNKTKTGPLPIQTY